MKLPHVVIVWSLSSVAMAGTTYFVDSEGGDDAANGQSERTAWKTLGRINRGEVGPGDTVLLKRGGLWRETLRPVSGRPGQPVCYSSYGSGRKPVIQRSLDFSRRDDWAQIGNGLWVTDGRRPITRDVGIVIFDHGRRWGVKTWRREGWQVPNSPYWRRHAQLKEELDYRYEPEEKRVVVRLRANPAALFRSVELVLTEHGVDQDRRATPNGAHLMYYHNSADASGVVVASNCFVNATEWTMRAGTDWRRGLRQDGNVIWNEKTVPVCRWLDGPSLRFLDWDGYQALGFDGHGEWRMPAACLRIKKEFQAIERQEDR